MNECRPQPVLFWFHVKLALSPGSAHHVAHVSPAVHVVAIGFAELLQQTARDLPRPKQMYLPRSSAAAVGRIPSGTMYSTGDRYRALGGGIKLLLTGYGIRPTCLRGGRGHRVSSSNLEPRHQFSVTSAESYGTYPPDASTLVSRETCLRA